MATAKELFYNSYLKKLKRPEFQANRSGSAQETFNPDDVFGANSVARSESVNPWAGRDKSNAKFGALGGNNNGGGDQGGMNQSEGLSALSSVLNSSTKQPASSTPTTTSVPQDQSALGVLGVPLAKYGGDLLGKSINDWMTTDKYSELDPMMQGYVEGVSGNVGSTMTPVDSGLDMGGYDKGLEGLMQPMQDDLVSTIAGTGSEVATDATGALPVAGAGMKAIGDLLSGKMFRRPAESLGEIGGGFGGTVGGAALGTAIFPGVGTGVGALLGGLLGGKGGGLLGRTFSRLFG